MIKLQDFATQMGVTDRQIQRLLKKYSEELEGTYERKGPNGTWLSDKCQEILRSKMRVKEVALVDDKLQQRIKELEERLERKDVIIERLQERETEKDKQIKLLKEEQLLLEQKTQTAMDEAVKSAEDQLKFKLQQEHQEQIKKLREHYNEKVKELEEAVRAEKNKSLMQKFFEKFGK